MNNGENVMNISKEGVDLFSRTPSKSTINEDLDALMIDTTTTASPLIIKKLIQYTRFENAKPYISQNNISHIMQDFTLNKIKLS